jgi:flagellar protein FliO/FliZ
MSLVWFAVVLALVPAGLWLLKRSGMAGPGGRPTGLHPRLLGSLAVGPQQRVVTVEVGEGAAKRWLVLGVTPQQVSTLMRSSQPLADLQGFGSAAPAATPVLGTSGFSQVLSRALGRAETTVSRAERRAEPAPNGARSTESRQPGSRSRSARASRTAPGGLSTLSAEADSTLSGGRSSVLPAAGDRQDARLLALRERLARGG